MSTRSDENVFDGRIQIDGGKPLPGCPESWEAAREWMDKVNLNKSDYAEPIWSWDCGFKLDFDGPLFHISGRFYPPKEGYGPSWDGSVKVYCNDQMIASKDFDTPTLDELKKDVETYTKEIRMKIFNAVILVLNKESEAKE